MALPLLAQSGHRQHANVRFAPEAAFRKLRVMNIDVGFAREAADIEKHTA